MCAVKRAENDEDDDAKDTEDVRLDGRPQRDTVSAAEQSDNGGIAGEPGSTILGQSGKGVAHHSTAFFEQDDDTSVDKWKKMQNLSYEKIQDRLIPEDLRIIWRATRTALQRAEWPEWMADVDWDKACLLLLSSLLWIGLATWYFRGGTEDNKKVVDASPKSSARTTPAGSKSSFGISEMARRAFPTYRHEGGYIYSKGTDRLRKRDAAAATIQRWARTEFKRWLRDRALSRSSIETSPLDSQRWTDEDHGAVVSTILKDRCVNVDTLGPPESERFSPATRLPSSNGAWKWHGRGGDHVDSSQHNRRRQKFSLSSKDISKVLIKLESRADPGASLSPVSKPP
ncbi:hypothetical protein MTO96_051108 [Rhipicephalus appendiculatus]